MVDSLATNALHLADIKWLRRVRSGVGMLLVGDITLLVTAIFLVAFLFVQSSTSPSALNSNATQWITQIAYVVFLGAIIFSLLGNVLVASDRLQARRVAIQFFFITGIVFEFVPTGWLVRFDPLGGSTILAFQRVMFPIAQCIGIALLRRIALLGSQARLARASRVLLWALIVGCALQSYEVAFSLYFASFRGSGFGRSTGSFLSGYSAAIAAAIIFLGAFVAEVFLLIRYRRLLADAIEVAKQRAAA
ncbi:MAG: hypothetical protein HY287_08265 [Planctomycetes bacterium]|nr:hypothetical protein [Planctomycetota bacterium]MBI3834308.1 hypothetical protein [Planctomycetota bacterium]